jgi:hypothetical protein
MQNSHHGAQFQKEAKALVHTEEFVTLAKFVEKMKTRKLPKLQEFKPKYIAAVKKLEMLHQKLAMTTQKTSKMVGQEPHQRLIVNVDDDQWYAFNEQYYKVREMEYYAMYKIPIIIMLRQRVSAVRHTNEMGQLQSHWAEVTHQDQHQVVIGHQGALLKEAVKTLHMSYPYMSK